jgi:hypothetical protein
MSDIGSYVWSFLSVPIHTRNIFRFSFCKPHMIDCFFCDSPPLPGVYVQTPTSVIFL